MAGVAAAPASPRGAVAAVERPARERTNAGSPLVSLPALSAEGEHEGFFQTADPLPPCFQPGRGPDYCRTCRGDGRRRARGEPGAGGRLCRYRERALISRSEHEARDVVFARQGRLRLAPSGHVIDIDMKAGLALAFVCGHDLAVLSELLASAKTGPVLALCRERSA
jgi:hypothetical protein